MPSTSYEALFLQNWIYIKTLGTAAHDSFGLLGNNHYFILDCVGYSGLRRLNFWDDGMNIERRAYIYPSS